MQTMTAAEAKQKFGQLMDKAQRGPVAITKHGRRVGIMYSAEDYEQEQVEKKAWLDNQLSLGIMQARDGNTVEGEKLHRDILASFED